MKILPQQCPRKCGLLRLALMLLAALLNPMVFLLAAASAAEVSLPNACTFTYTLTDLGTLSGYRFPPGPLLTLRAS